MKLIFFCKEKQDFSAATTPQYKVMLFYKDTSPLDNISQKKKSKTHKLTNQIHSFLEQFYKNTRLIFVQNLRTN